MYLAIEGVDTCGKSTQIELIKGVYPNAIFTKEPGGTNLGMKFREILLGEYNIDKRAEFLLFLADRAQHSAEVLAPNIAQNRVIISDRSMVSGLAYSKGLFDENFLLDATSFAMNGLKPDIVILLKLTEEKLSDRLSNKEHDRIEKQGIKYLLSVQSNIEYCCNLLGIRLIILDASESRESIFREISKIIEG